MKTQLQAKARLTAVAVTAKTDWKAQLKADAKALEKMHAAMEKLGSKLEKEGEDDAADAVYRASISIKQAASAVRSEV